MPKISIIIPVYNAEKYLRKCIESVIAQTFKDWEAILINDGSKDSSLAVCYEYATKDKRISVIDKTNGGPSSARNRGLEQARGEYIYFIDADDWIESNALEILYFNSDNGYFDIVFVGFVREYSNGNMEYSYAYDADTYSLPKESIICHLYKEQAYGWICTKMLKKEIIEKYNIRFDESIELWEDEMFTSEYLNHVSSVRAINNHPYHYICNVESIMQTNNKRYEKVFLSARKNEVLMPLANEELKEYLNNTYNQELKYSLIMALKNETYYQCDDNTKDKMLDLYYSRCKSHPEVLGYNIFSNKIAYLIVECILQTRSKSLIKFLLPKI